MKRLALLAVSSLLLLGLAACAGSGSPHRRYRTLLDKAEDASYMEASYVTTVRIPLAGDSLSIHTTGSTRRQGGGSSLRMWGDRTLELWEQGYSYTHWYRDGELRLEPFSEGLGASPLSLEECFPLGLLELDGGVRGHSLTDEGLTHFSFSLDEGRTPELERVLEGLIHPALEVMELELGLAWEAPTDYYNAVYTVEARGSIPESASLGFFCTLLAGGQEIEAQVIHFTEFGELGGEGEISFPDGFDSLPRLELERAA